MQRRRYFHHLPPLRSMLMALAFALALPQNAALAAPDDQAMKDALNAARKQQWERIDQSAIQGHVLEGYVEYHRLKSRLPQAAPAEIKTFIERHADSPLAQWMRGQAISAYGEARQYASLLAVSDGKPSGAERQCYYYTALLDRDYQTAAQGGRRLWQYGHSRPEACDPLFNRLKQHGAIGPLEVWERLMLAWQSGESGLMSYLGRQLGAGWQDGLDSLAQVRQDYSAIIRVPARIGPQGRGTSALVAAAMHGYTRADTQEALDAWQRISPRLEIAAEDRREIEHDLILYSLVRNVGENRVWADQALSRNGDADLLELRVRAALGERDWQGVIDWVHRMEDDQRREARWQYWLGRALGQLGDAITAEKAYRVAAGERDFYGFAAADRLGQPYALNLRQDSYNEAYRQRIARWPVVERTEALMRIGEVGLANSEWYAASARLADQDVKALADYAESRGWYAKLVQTTIAGKLWDALAWRFPAAYREQFLHWGNANSIDPYLLMAISRRESAYNPTVISPAGARGLMQLMPGTATLVSRKIGVADPGPYGVLQPEVNIRLGSRYFKDMLERYRGNRLAATAAYNAGPGRVDRWLKEAPREFDLFVESIPFRETRQYVQAVLAYRVIFESLAQGGDTRNVALLTPTEQRVDYDASLLARQ
ncbi:transglycosylase SLT domain-containing protein [Pistricoccus aurantiacus]|uniref:transglycosylase SLT domain-containing protein n=1 Tax=Pistricoccus aurantiacus TaxID=1883414 RepID=UPI003624C8B5